MAAKRAATAENGGVAGRRLRAVRFVQVVWVGTRHSLWVRASKGATMKADIQNRHLMISSFICRSR